jgi:hypothetical protein
VLLLTRDAVLKCAHAGVVRNTTSQPFVTIAGRLVEVEADPEGRTIAGCPNIGATIKPCTHTLQVRGGYSTFVRIAGQPVCLDTVWGLTDGTPPGAVRYTVASPGQSFVSETG